MSVVNPGSGFRPVDTFLVVNPAMPEAGEVRMDEDTFPAWQANGWVRVEDMAKAEAPKAKAAK